VGDGCDGVEETREYGKKMGRGEEKSSSFKGGGEKIIGLEG